MHGPDGVDYPNRVVYEAIERPSRIAYTHDDGEGHENFRATLEHLAAHLKKG
jgi:uncharacterized protein YndB with AHSA1/START domain